MTSYPSQHFYRVFALISLVVAALFAWDLLQGPELGSVLFFGISLGLLAWSVRAAFTNVALAPDHFRVEAPFVRPRQVEYRQILSVTEEGRMSKSIVVAYHPRTTDGLLDLNRADTIVLPAVQNQDALYEQLLQRVPA